MEENNELFNENEFLNILNEPESTLPDDIIFGASDSCTEKDTSCPSNCDDGCSTAADSSPCDDACTADSGGICKADDTGCTSQGTRGSTGDTGNETAQTTYYYALQIKAVKKGYYIPSQLPSGTYQLTATNPVGFWFNSVSGANDTVRSILTNGYTTNTGYSITTAATCVFAASGTTNVAFISTSTTQIAGYVFLSASATNKKFSNTISYPLAVYAKLWPNSQSASFFTAYDRIATGQTTLGYSQDYYMKEKTFSIYTKYNNIPVQGSIVTISNVDTYFPQYAPYPGYKILTGYDGGVILSTSSVTGTTITGFVDRIGFNGNSHVTFTATADTICTVNLSHTNVSERYELPLYEMVKTNDLLDPLVDIYYDGGVIQEIGPSLTPKMLNSNGFSAETSPAINQLQFIRAYDLIRTKPALSYITNDPVLGKYSELSYTISNDITITTELTQVATFAWDVANVYLFNYPTITRTGTTSTVQVEFYATTTVNSITYSNVLIKTVTCNQDAISVSQTLNFDILTSQHGTGASGSMSIILYVKKTTNVGTLKLKSGTYNYSYTSGGDGNTPVS